MSSATLERPTSSPADSERDARNNASSRPTAASSPTAPSYRTLFTVDFRTAMTDADVQRLNSVLDMATHLHSKLPANPTHPGVSRLDFHSGLFLLRGDGPDQWRLQGRTWGTPAPETAHGWHLAAAHAARLLDPGVPVPARLKHTERAAAPLPRRGRRPRRSGLGRQGRS